MEREPQTAQERAVLLLRATLLPGWKLPVSQWLVWAIRGAIVLGVCVLIASAVDKSLWDWLELLIIPVVLAVGGYLFTRSENRRAQRIEEQRAQESTLEAYLEQVTPLVREGLRDEDPLSPSRLLVRGRTLSLFWQLDPKRKRRLLQILHEAGLIGKETPVIGLSGADLRNAYLRELDLKDAALNGADMKGANLERADVRGADLSGADLLGARGVTEEQLEQAASLQGATMPNGQKYEDWLRSKGSGEE